MILCSVKLYSPCLHLSLPKHLTDPYCLGPYCACLSVCLCVWVCAHLSKHYKCMCTYVCIACVCMCQSPGVLVQLLECVCARKYVSLRSTQGPLRKKRPGHTHSSRSLKRSRARFARPPSPHAEQHSPLRSPG